MLQQRRVESTPSGGKKKKPGDDDDEGERKKGANTNVEDMDEDRYITSDHLNFKTLILPFSPPQYLIYNYRFRRDDLSF